METTITRTQVQPIVNAIIAFYGNEPERVRKFYAEVAPKLMGKHPLFDAILDEIDGWLISMWPAPQEDDAEETKWEEIDL